MTTTRTASVVVVGRHDCSHFDAVRASCEKSGLEDACRSARARRRVLLRDTRRRPRGHCGREHIGDAVGRDRLAADLLAVRGEQPALGGGGDSPSKSEMDRGHAVRLHGMGQQPAEGWLLDPQLLSLQDSKPFLLRQFAHHAPLVRVPPWAVSSAPAPLLTRIGPAVVKSVNAWQEIREGRYLNTAFVSEHLRSRVTTTEPERPPARPVLCPSHHRGTALRERAAICGPDSDLPGGGPRCSRPARHGARRGRRRTRPCLRSRGRSIAAGDHGSPGPALLRVRLRAGGREPACSSTSTPSAVGPSWRRATAWI